MIIPWKDKTGKEEGRTKKPLHPPPDVGRRSGLLRQLSPESNLSRQFKSGQKIFWFPAIFNFDEQNFEVILHQPGLCSPE